MDFKLTSEQQQFRDAISGFAQKNLKAGALKRELDSARAAAYRPPMSVAQILDELPALTSDERLRVIARAAELQDHSFTAEEDALIDARLAEHDRAPETAIPLNEFTAQLRSRHGL